VTGPYRPTALRVVSASEIEVGRHFWEELPDEWRALLAWCRLHGLDPELMPVQQTIVRNFKRARIEYDEFVIIDGCRVHDERELDQVQVRRTFRQGETPPMPFPDVILAHLDRKEPA
jgi:hypothetical protein